MNHHPLRNGGLASASVATLGKLVGHAPGRSAPIAWLALLATGITPWLGGCQHYETPRREVAAVSVEGPVTVEPRTQLLPAFPCSSCHAYRAPKPKRYRLIRFHRERNAEFSHGEDEFWCYQCHSLKDIDRLRMANRKLVTFDEAYLLCTSCHGEKLHDWQRGIHGQTSGFWNGPKTRKSCTACHDPHDPRFKSMQPEKMPAPARSGSH